MPARPRVERFRTLSLPAFRIADLQGRASFPLMPRLLSRQFRHCPGLLGRLVAVLAILSQLVLGAIVLPDNRPGVAHQGSCRGVCNTCGIRATSHGTGCQRSGSVANSEPRRSTPVLAMKVSEPANRTAAAGRSRPGPSSETPASPLSAERCDRDPRAGLQLAHGAVAGAARCNPAFTSWKETPLPHTVATGGPYRYQPYSLAT
jgi:hypothetical protein